ncbi:hypothetical protein [Nonomuraea sp. NPDC050643]|uniref:hypothetical protein n=1 Tax=Nonomuraea sp. NPDC050643 TaxID=3155660 RepID=UPI0033C3B1FD
MIVRMVCVPRDEWSFTMAREPARFGTAQVKGVSGIAHAAVDGGTLCGIPEQQITRYRHLFDPRARRACRDCRRRADAAPTRPCVQERLHNRIQEAAQGRARDDLLAALSKGAEVALWINGPSTTLTRNHARVEELTDGAGSVADALNATMSIVLACVEDGPWRFVVVLPQDGDRPLVARGPRGSH